MTRARLGTMVAIAAAAIVVGAVFGRPGTGRAADSKPVNTAKPAITGTTTVGDTLTASSGTWTGSPTPTYTYAWNRCDAKGANCVAIDKATAATYKLTADDTGHTLTVTVTATNTSGSASASSTPTAVVASPPTNTALPAITGTLGIGSTLTASNGTWSGSPTSYAYAWERCDSKGDNCAAIGGATKNAYTLTKADGGTTLRATVTATNAAGSTPATSAATTAVPAFNGCPAGTGAIKIADLESPARLTVARATIVPHVVTLRTHSIQLHVKVTACNGRPVEGAAVFAAAIPYNQFTSVQRTTGADGTVTLNEGRRRGFPARSRNQHLLPMLVRATKPGAPVLDNVSTRRMVAFHVSE